MTDADQIKGTIRKLREQAEDGHAESMFLLAVAHAQGKGVERNDTAAARWFLQAARKGHLRAKTSIGYLYATGRGVKHDLVLGFIFLSRAAREGDPLANDLLIKIRNGMSPAQLKEAEQRAREAA